ncbi:ABC transporter ATP-binding protein [Clostridia bacterium]|nr:ABC transporter ATP-binding protein [Clostridia bacterium]
MDILATISGLSVRYGRTLAVDNLSFDVRAQEVLAVIGPNGSGKTSAIEVLEGLRLPSDGTVSVFGLSPHSHHKEIYKGLGVQLQDVAYPDKIKVAELCDLFASFYETPADYKRLLEQLDLQDKAKRTVSKLSGGEKQRLSILLALLPRPKLLILDELTTGLDPEVRRGLWEALKAAKKAGVGILLVSHYMDEVETLADRVLFMLKGKPLFNGTLPELRAFAKSKIDDNWSEEMSLEDIYLALIPQKTAFELEVGV